MPSEMSSMVIVSVWLPDERPEAVKKTTLVLLATFARKTVALLRELSSI